jgi:hypothetical protein
MLQQSGGAVRARADGNEPSSEIRVFPDLVIWLREAALR